MQLAFVTRYLLLSFPYLTLNLSPNLFVLQKEELSVFKQERKALVKVLKRVQFDLSAVDTTVHCLRGYEAYFSIQANKEYKMKRQMVWKAVLQEQARQRGLGRMDAMMTQLVSSHATQWARDTATELGMRDAQVALVIFMDYMQEQQEDDDIDEDCLSFDDEYDDAPIAVNWNEPLDFGEDPSLRPELDFSLRHNNNNFSADDSMEPLQLSSQELNRSRLSNSRMLNISNHPGSSSHGHNHSNRAENCLPPLQPYPTSNNNNSSSCMPYSNNGSGCNTTAARAS